MKKIIIYSIFLIGCFALGVFGFNSLQSEYTTIPNKIDNYSTTHASWAYDVEDKVLVSDFSSNIFIGTVEKLLGTKETEEKLLYTDMVVNVFGNLKGNINDKRVIVSQFGGYNEETKTLITMEGDEIPKKGETYVFYTSYVKDDDVYLTSALPFGKVSLPTPDIIKNKISTVVINENKGNFSIENDYVINKEVINNLLNNTTVRELDEKIKIAKAKPGIWKEKVFRDDLKGDTDK